MTLIELLITMLILSILAGALLGVAAVAGETAREARSRVMVARLHTLLMEHLDTYKSRRIKLQPDVEQAIDDLPVRQRGKARAEARLYALREMMLMEIPDRWSDVLLNGVPATNAGSAVPLQPIFLDVSASQNGRTELANVYLRRYWRIAQNAVTSSQVQALTDNQGAECLYMIITTATADGEARSLFNESSIGDTDGDGAREFLDGWGHPINFLRWAPGFESDLQLNLPVLERMAPVAANRAVAEDHDPFDLFRMEERAFRLVPLIFSGGRDETFGIRLVKPYVAWLPASAPSAAMHLPGWPRFSPYWPVDGFYLGSDNGEQASIDNIHNHLLGER